MVADKCGRVLAVNDMVREQGPTNWTFTLIKTEVWISYSVATTTNSRVSGVK